MLGVSVLIVTFEEKEAAKKWHNKIEISWPLLLDEDRSLYHHYGMFKAKFWDIWSFKTMIAYTKELLKGQTPSAASGDIQQCGGDILIDTNGIVRFHHVGDGPADRPSVENILSEIN